jgi:hypothetical protein
MKWHKDLRERPPHREERKIACVDQPVHAITMKNMGAKFFLNKHLKTKTRFS